MPWCIYVVAYLGVCVVGWLVVAVCLYGMRRLVVLVQKGVGALGSEAGSFFTCVLKE
jgi:hypothetical protein